MNKLTNDAIKQAAEKHLGEAPKFPVEVVKIAKNLGYSVFHVNGDSDLKGAAGKVDHENKKIFVKPSDPVQRQRFTIAHEIAHLVLHTNNGKPMHFRCGHTTGKVYGDSREEVEANKFAAMLLMPEDEFQKVWGQYNGSVDDVADWFNVSRLAASVRANTLGLMSL